MPVDATKQLCILKAQAIDAARTAQGLTLKDLAARAGVSYRTCWKSTNGRAIGVDLAGRIVAALGVELAAVQAGPDEGRPADGISPEAWAHFLKTFTNRQRKLIDELYREVESEARRRCWFWPRIGVIRERLAAGDGLMRGGTRWQR
jgi:transcriptional regulator with XRE-family HTH domain